MYVIGHHWKIVAAILILDVNWKTMSEHGRREKKERNERRLDDI